MRVISKKVLVEYGDKHSNAKQTLLAWHKEISKGIFTTPQDIKKLYADVSFVENGNERVIFNIGGNKYRLIVSIDYKRNACFIKWIGTHAEYDKIDATTVNSY